MSFEIDSLVEIQNVGVQRVVADYGHELHVVNDETGAVARVPAAWCELVEVPLSTQDDDLGAAMAAAEAAGVVVPDPPVLTINEVPAADPAPADPAAEPGQV